MRPSFQKNRYTLAPDEYKKPVINKGTNTAILFTRKGEEIIIDIPSFEYVNSKMPYYVSNKGQIIRARRRSDKETYKRFSLIQLSRELFGFPPRRYSVYFINGNKSDCRVANMRLVEKAESLALEARRNASKVDPPEPQWEPEDYEKYVDNETYINLRANLNVEDILDIRRKESTAKVYAKKYKTTESVVATIWHGRIYKNIVKEV